MAETVNKGHLVDKVSESTGMSKQDVKRAVDGVFEHITEHLKQGDKVQITGFGAFEVRQRQERSGVKPGTSEKITIPASKAPAFKAGKSLKDSVNN